MANSAQMVFPLPVGAPTNTLSSLLYTVLNTEKRQRGSVNTERDSDTQETQPVSPEWQPRGVTAHGPQLQSGLRHLSPSSAPSHTRGGEGTKIKSSGPLEICGRTTEAKEVRAPSLLLRDRMPNQGELAPLLCPSNPLLCFLERVKYTEKVKHLIRKPWHPDWVKIKFYYLLAGSIGVPLPASVSSSVEQDTDGSISNGKSLFAGISNRIVEGMKEKTLGVHPAQST